MKFQVSLLHMMLLLALVAVWVAAIMQRQEVVKIETQLPGLREVARELDVRDPDVLHAVESNPEWMGEYRWQIHVPELDNYTLCLVTTGLDDEEPADGYSPQLTKVMSAGVRIVDLRVLRNGQNHVVEVCIDDEVELTAENPPEWLPGSHSSNAHSQVSVSDAHDRPTVLLLEKRFNHIDNQEVTGGIRLWIRKESE